MTTSHFISDVVLAQAAAVSFCLGGVPQNTRLRIMWGVFALSVSATAAAGAVRYLGNPGVVELVGILKLFAGTMGAAGIAVAAWSAIRKEPAEVVSALALVVGLAAFVAATLLENPMIGLAVQGPAMILILVLGIHGVATGKGEVARPMLIGIFCLTLAEGGRRMMAANNIGEPLHPLDWYHYWLALGMLSLGWMGRKSTQQPSL